MSEQKSIFLPIVFHFHQPVDNFDHVIEDCYEKSYGPLIGQIYNHPDVKITLHFSGNLLDWFIKNKPELIEKVKIMAKRGQIEIIGGGYYEPIFAIIPTRDKIAQMRKLSHRIKEEFGLEVSGAWLSERVWEPNYPSFLTEVGLKYVIVDDNHFRSSGITQEGTLYSYITEDEGKTLRVFPINEPLRYLTPWKPTYMAVDYLKSVADENGDRVALLISDAEKMGVWGSTHQFCYVEGKGHEEGDNGKPFITAFFEQIEKNDWIKTITLSEYMNQHPAINLVYLPTASYDKMEEWVLPSDSRKKYEEIEGHIENNENLKDAYQFLKGGFWRYFLVKYPESNNMHKKMLHVREKLIQIENKIKNLKDTALISNLKPKVLETWDEIYKSQCNDCYWHGLFGGVYLQFLRFSVYTHLINAEKLIDEMKSMMIPQQMSYISINPIDFTKNSKLDVLIESKTLNLYIDPSDGGTIFELDYKPKSYNLLNTLTRWFEAYHERERVEKGEIKVDRFKRNMLRLRFYHDDVTLEELEADNYYEFGDFISGNFKITKNEIENNIATLVMEREGSIKDTTSDDRIPCIITKTINIEENQVDISIKGAIKEIPEDGGAMSRIIENLNIAVDIPFFFNGDPNDFLWKSKQVESAEVINEYLLEPFQFFGSHFKAHDKTYDLSFEIDLKSDHSQIKINSFPLISQIKSDLGDTETYQGMNVTPMVKLKKDFQIDIKLSIS